MSFFSRRSPQSAQFVQITVAINFFIFAIAWLSDSINFFATNYGMHPAAIAFESQTWRLLTAGFLHASWLHLIFNMVLLWTLGSDLERLLGHSKFAALYLVSLLGGSVTSYWFSNPGSFSVGASGAVFGLMGAFLVVGSRLNQGTGQIWALIGINVVIGFLAPGIDWRAHLGGLLTGAALAWFLARRPSSTGKASAVLGVITTLAILQWSVTARTNELLFLYGGLA